MRALLFLASIVLLALPLPLAAAEESFNCHSWEILVGDRETGAGVSTEDGATYTAAGGVYVVNDGPPVLNPWIFSIWIAEEQNGVPGYQRNDGFCDETNDGQIEPECLLSCTF